MDRKRVLILIVAVFLASASAYAAQKNQYIPPSDPEIPVIGNWARSYNVSAKDGSMFSQMEIFSFRPFNEYEVFYYAEGSKKPFRKYIGHYEFEAPFLQLFGHKKGGILSSSEVWHDCVITSTTLACGGYHNKNIPFARWNKEPGRLEEKCCW